MGRSLDFAILSYQLNISINKNCSNEKSLSLFSQQLGTASKGGTQENPKCTTLKSRDLHNQDIVRNRNAPGVPH